MSDNSKNDAASNGPASNFFNKLRMKVAMLASPSTLTPDEFLELVGLDTNKIAQGIVERYYQDLIKEHTKQFVDAVATKDFAKLEPKVLASLVMANDYLDERQKTKIIEIFAQSGKNAPYIV